MKTITTLLIALLVCATVSCKRSSYEDAKDDVKDATN